MRIGEALQIALKNNRMTQREFADTIHVTQQAVSEWVTDKSLPSSDKIADINDILGIDLIKMNSIGERRREGSMDMDNIKIKDIGTYEDAKEVSLQILKEMDIERNYSYAVFRLLYWLLPATIGLTNHERLNNKDADLEYEISDVREKLNDYFEEDFINVKRGLYENRLEYDFYIMGMDLFESFEPYIIEDHDFASSSMEDWYKFQNAVIKSSASTVYSELLVAMTEIANI